MFIAALGARGIVPPSLCTKAYYQAAYIDRIYAYSFQFPRKSLAYSLGIGRIINIGSRPYLHVRWSPRVVVQRTLLVF